MHFNGRSIRIVPLALSLSLLVCTAAWGASKQKGPVIEPKARQVLQQVGDFMKSAERFTFSMEATREVVMETGQKIQYGSVHEIAVRKPDGVKVISDGDQGDFKLWYDGSRITLLSVERNTYSSAEVPGTIDEAFDKMAKERGISPPMISLLYSDPIQILKNKVRSGFYVGLSKVRGVECHQLAFSSKDRDLQIWISTGISPVIRKVVLTNRKEKYSPQFTAYLSGWDFSPVLPDTIFMYILPKGAILADFDSLRPSDSGGN
jgi:hypothetical protein